MSLSNTIVYFPLYFIMIVDYAVEMSHFGLFLLSGQACLAGSRTFVQEDIYDEFVKKSVARAKKRTIGDPFEATTEGGPQVGLKQLIFKRINFVLSRIQGRPGNVRNC